MKVKCPVCKRFIQVTRKGKLFKHGFQRWKGSSGLEPSNGLLGPKDNPACEGSGTQAPVIMKF